MLYRDKFIFNVCSKTAYSDYLVLLSHGRFSYISMYVREKAHSNLLVRKTIVIW